MKTCIQQVDPVRPDGFIMNKAANILRNGGLVAFPTETVYGLGANGLDKQACRKIYQAKGRPSDNPLILHICNENQLLKIVSVIPPKAKAVMDAFWPGPITLIFPKSSLVPMEVTGGRDTVAVRCPSHPVARALIEAADLPIAAPSANLSGKPSPTQASHVIEDLLDRVDMILDGGATEVGLESTILDLTEEIPMILRPGAVTLEMLEEKIGRVQVDPAVLEKPDSNLIPKAPGMKYTHYAPKAQVKLVRGQMEKVISFINAQCKEDIEKGISVGVMATEETKQQYSFGKVLSVGSREDMETVGHRLFATLREFDALEVERVYAEIFEESGEGMAVMNRLKKSAGYHFIDV